MFFSDKKRSVPGLNTTSTADISFMLLIFFLVTTSLDVDKGLTRQLPPPEPKQEDIQPTDISKEDLLTISIMPDGDILVNGKSEKADAIGGEIIDLVHRVGKRHLVSLSTDRNATYDTYFKVQNAIANAYNRLWDEQAQRQFGKAFSRLSDDEKQQVRKVCPQRVAEEYNPTTEDSQEKGGQR